MDSDSNLLDLSGQRRAGSRLGELRDGHRSPASSAVSRTKESGWPDSPIVSGNEKLARCPLSWVGSGRARTGAVCVGGQILTGKNCFLTGKNWHPALQAIRLRSLLRGLSALGQWASGFGLLAVYARRHQVYGHRLFQRATSPVRVPAAAALA